MRRFRCHTLTNPSRLQTHQLRPARPGPTRWTPYGLKVTNPVHQLTCHFRTDHVAATRRDANWAWSWVLERAGRDGETEAVASATPVLALPDDSSLPRLEYRRGNIVEWYTNTLQGVKQGFDIATRPPGNGPLVLEARVDGLQPRVADAGDTIVYERDGARAFTYAGLVVLDATGRTVPSMMALTEGGLKLVVSDSGAQYPLMIDPTSGACPARWCGDGDTATLDVCEYQADGSAGCSHPVDPAAEGGADHR